MTQGGRRRRRWFYLLPMTRRECSSIQKWSYLLPATTRDCSCVILSFAPTITINQVKYYMWYWYWKRRTKETIKNNKKRLNNNKKKKKKRILPIIIGLVEITAQQEEGQCSRSGCPYAPPPTHWYTCAVVRWWGLLFLITQEAHHPQPEVPVVTRATGSHTPFSKRERQKLQ